MNTVHDALLSLIAMLDLATRFHDVTVVAENKASGHYAYPLLL